MKENLLRNNQINGSPEVMQLLNNLNNLKLAEGVNSKMQPLLSHLKMTIAKTREEIISNGRDVFIVGPDWCRRNSTVAGQAHSEVIVKTYGSTYALPNKDPKSNKVSLDEGNLDMFLMFDKSGKPIGTACLVFDGGWAELGRVASLGHVGNRLIQDIRILRWLTDGKLAKKFHSLFATIRTAPDRNIGTLDKPEIMRGGQAIGHIWAKMPNVVIAGFGPLYKKHGALEQFAFGFITQSEMVMPEKVWVADKQNQAFMQTWLEKHGLAIPKTEYVFLENNFKVKEAPLPPEELGITQLVHADVHLSEMGTESPAEQISFLEKAGAPFIQFPLPVNINTCNLQEELKSKGFQAFQFTPGLKGIQSPLLWFGKINGKIPVVPTFWQADSSKSNPFWQGELTEHANRISNAWSGHC